MTTNGNWAVNHRSGQSLRESTPGSLGLHFHDPLKIHLTECITPGRFQVLRSESFSLKASLPAKQSLVNLGMKVLHLCRSARSDVALRTGFLHAHLELGLVFPVHLPARLPVRFGQVAIQTAKSFSWPKREPRPNSDFFVSLHAWTHTLITPLVSRS